MTADTLLLLAAQFLAMRGETPPQKRVRQDETLVTARKQAEPLAQVPLCVTVLDEHALEEFHLTSVRDAAARIPNLYMSEFSARRLSFPFVRGVGSGINEPAVITYVDDVPQFGFGGTNLPLFALERLEFLRGPQGTLYGKNALGGLIHVHGRRPTDARSIDLALTKASEGQRDYSAAFSGPLGAGLLGDFAVLDAGRAGYTVNNFADASPGNDVDFRDGQFGRGRVLWQPSASSELDFSIFGESARDGGFVLRNLQDVPALGITEDEPHHINQDFEGLANRDVVNPALVWRVFGDAVDFTSVSSWETWDVLELSDFDFSSFDAVRRRSEEDQQYYYQELRVGSSPDAQRGEFRWLLGGSGFKSDAERQAANTFRPGGAGIFFPPANVGIDATDGQFDDLGLAAFGQLSLPLGGSFELTGGLRYDHEQKEADLLHTFDPGSGPSVLSRDERSRTDNSLLPTFGASWFGDEVGLVFARASSAFKAGGFNLSAPAGQEEFEEETALTYELGWRSTSEEQGYSLGATLFLVQWEDMQLAQFDQFAGGFVTNAGDSNTRGLELEAQHEITDGFEGFATFGWLDSEIEDFTDSFGTDTSGNELPFAPDNTWSLGFVYGGELPSGATWSFGADYGRVGDFFYDAGNRAGDDYGIANLRLGVDSESYGFAVWLRNALDEEYETVAFQPSPVDPTVFVGESGAPRVLGFTLSIHL